MIIRNDFIKFGVSRLVYEITGPAAKPGEEGAVAVETPRPGPPPPHEIRNHARSKAIAFLADKTQAQRDIDAVRRLKTEMETAEAEKNTPAAMAAAGRLIGTIERLTGKKTPAWLDRELRGHYKDVEAERQKEQEEARARAAAADIKLQLPTCIIGADSTQRKTGADLKSAISESLKSLSSQQALLLTTGDPALTTITHEQTIKDIKNANGLFNQKVKITVTKTNITVSVEPDPLDETQKASIETARTALRDEARQKITDALTSAPTADPSAWRDPARRRAILESRVRAYLGDTQTNRTAEKEFNKFLYNGLVVNADTTLPNSGPASARVVFGATDVAAIEVNPGMQLSSKHSGEDLAETGTRTKEQLTGIVGGKINSCVSPFDKYGDASDTNKAVYNRISTYLPSFPINSGERLLLQGTTIVSQSITDTQGQRWAWSVNFWGSSPGQFTITRVPGTAA